MYIYIFWLIWEGQQILPKVYMPIVHSDGPDGNIMV